MAEKRDDIQGLRAVGALLVATYHIWLGRVSGGVDVFFVVSGFLLIGSLARKVEIGQRIDFIGFSTRLARRILPGAYLVLAATAVSAPFWIPLIKWRTTIDQMVASVLYLENWYLADAAIDYLKRDQVGSPVQHYWAMAAQVQALLLLAFVLAVISWSAWFHNRNRLLGLLGGIAAASFVYAVDSVAKNQAFAYYDTFARLWEFAIGGIIGLAYPKIVIPGKAREPLGWLALLALPACGILLQVSTSFPGWAALWPVLAASTLLVTGGRAGDGSGANRLLASRPLRAIGDISYHLYLWHWPLLICYLILSGRTEASFGSGIAILMASMGLAYLTTHHFENWFGREREGALDHRWRTVFGSGAAVAGFSVGLFFWNSQLHELRAAEIERIVVAEIYPGARVLSGARVPVREAPMLPAPFAALHDVASVYNDGCHASLTDATVRSCNYGNRDAPHSIALIGGSHSVQWLGALQEIIARRPDWRIATFTKAGCRVTDELASMKGEEQQSCQVWNMSLIRKLAEERFDIVVTMATSGEDGRETIPPGYREKWMEIAALGSHVIAIRDNPWIGGNVPECVEMHGRSAAQCTGSRTLLAKKAPWLDLAAGERVHFVDLTDQFCGHTNCPAVIGNILVYRDGDHITQTYMRTVAPALEKEIAPLLAQIETSTRGR